MRRRGEIAEALSHAASMGPATVRELAQRAQVGYAAARYTESRMTLRGELVRLTQRRPVLVALPVPDDDAQPCHGARLQLPRSFWDLDASCAQPARA